MRAKARILRTSLLLASLGQEHFRLLISERASYAVTGIIYQLGNFTLFTDRLTPFASGIGPLVSPPHPHPFLLFIGFLFPSNLIIIILKSKL